MATFSRGDYSAKRGTQVITDSLTFTGTGGVDGCSLGTGVDGQIVAFNFGKLNVVTNLSASVIGMGNSATLTETIMARPGSIIGVAAYANAAITAGSIAVMPTINGTTKLTATLNTTNQSSAVTQAKDTDTFTAKQRLGCKITSATNLDSETKDLMVTIFVEV